MAIEYPIHYRGAQDTLRAAIDIWADPELLRHVTVVPGTKPARASCA